DQSDCQLPDAGTPATSGDDPYYDGWPGYVVDEPASQARAMGWMAFLYGASGELYFDVGHCLATAWSSQQFAYDGNGDGTLFYPGTTELGGQDPFPVESLRLKRIRDGHEDYEYLKALADCGAGGQARSVAHQLFPTIYRATVSDECLAAARLQLGTLISQCGHPSPR